MNILITGGNGYIAKSLYSALKTKYNICLITRETFDLCDTNQTSDWFSGKYFDTVIHTAIVGGRRLKPDDDSIVTQNMMMYQNLLINKRHYDKFISFGSGAEIFAKDTPYGISKRKIASSILHNHNFFNIRIFGLFDENELSNRFIKANILRYINKNPMIIHSNKIMDFFYMKDLINLVNYYLIETKLQKEINCCYDTKYTLINIANMINNLSHHKVPITLETASLLDFYCAYNVDYPIDLIGLEAGIYNTYNSILDNLNE